MKWFLISLAISLTASDKLDRTYLPPPGAQFAGGNPGDILVPLETPNYSQQGSVLDRYVPNKLNDFAAKDLSKSPVTTTSYAFTQTTTYPSVESYNTNVVPINPFIGLPVQSLGQNDILQPNQKLPSYSQRNDVSSGNIQPGHLNPKEIQNIIRPEGGILIPSFNYQQSVPNPDLIQHPSDQFPDQYLRSNVRPTNDITELGPQVSGIHQSIDKQITSPQQRPLDVVSQANILPQNQYYENKGEKVTHGNSNRPTGIDSMSPTSNQGYQNHGLANLGESPQQQLPQENHSTFNPEFNAHKNVHQPGQNYSDVTVPNLLSPVSAYSSVGNINRPQRPQAEGDRNAVILNYENVRTPTGYSYSYDTSNGIHTDESGTVSDGTKAQGSYSYTGDDGKIYSVFYTADENGFQPHGDHIPTAPPIPDAIKRVIEQAAIDEAAGIMDDGSYDENKYGHEKYQSPVNHRRIQENNFELQKVDKNSGISDAKYIENNELSEISDGDSKEKTAKFPSLKENDVKILKGDYDGRYSTGFKGKETIGVSSETPKSIRPALDSYILPGSKEYENQPQVFGRKEQTPNKTPQAVFKSNNNKYSINNTNNELSFVDINDNNVRQDVRVNSENFSKRPDVQQKSQKGSHGALDSKYVIKMRPPVSPDTSAFKNSDNFDSKKIDMPDFVHYHQHNTHDTPSTHRNVQGINRNGYQYNKPKNQTERNKFQTRFNVDKMLTTERTYQTTSESSGPLTPEVLINAKNRKAYSNRKSTTPEPFMTSRVSTSEHDLYDDNEEDEDIFDKSVGTTSHLSGGINDDTIHKFQYTPTETPSFTESSSITPLRQSFKSDDTETSQTDQVHTSTTEIPTSSSVFTNTGIPTSSNLFTNTGTPNYSYETTRPSLDLDTSITLNSSSKVIPNYSTSIPSEFKEYNQRGYSTSTYKPAPSTTFQNTLGYLPVSDNLRPSGLPDRTQSLRTGTEYQYQPVKSDHDTTQNSERLNSGIVPNYFTNIGHRPVDYSGPMEKGSTSGRPGFFTSFGPAIKYDHTSPDYASDIVFSTPSYTPLINSESPESQVYQTSAPGYEYGPSKPLYPTTPSLTTPGTIPHVTIPSTQPNFHSIPTTQHRPAYSSIPNIQKQNPLVGETQRYPEFNDQGRMFGENFSGPKQPQKYDPQTGYYY